MRFSVNDFVLIQDSVFPDKVGRVGVVTSVDPRFENPYLVDVPGDSESRFSGGLKRVSPTEALRMLNRLVGEVAELKARAAEPAEEPSGYAP